MSVQSFARLTPQVLRRSICAEQHQHRLIGSAERVPTWQRSRLEQRQTVPWEYAENTIDVVQKLKQEGTKAFGVEQYEGSIDYASVQYPERCATAVGGAPQDAVAFIFGNEVGGVSLDVLAECDEVIEIPMKGEKESLNVSVAAGIILFHFV